MKRLIVALALASLAVPAFADAPTPTNPSVQDQARVTHAKDWRTVSAGIVASLKGKADGKSVSVSMTGESPFVRALSAFVMADLHSAGIVVKDKGGDISLALSTQYVSHTSRNGYNLLDPLPNTAVAAGAVGVKEVLENSNSFNLAILTMGLISDVTRMVNKKQKLDELVLTATASGETPFYFAESFYIPSDESFNYRDAWLKPSVLKVNPTH